MRAHLTLFLALAACGEAPEDQASLPGRPTPQQAVRPAPPGSGLVGEWLVCGRPECDAATQGYQFRDDGTVALIRRIDSTGVFSNERGVVLLQPSPLCAGEILRWELRPDGPETHLVFSAFGNDYRPRSAPFRWGEGQAEFTLRGAQFRRVLVYSRRQIEPPLRRCGQPTAGL